MRYLELILLCLLLVQCGISDLENETDKGQKEFLQSFTKDAVPEKQVTVKTEVNVQFTDGFDFPVGKPDAQGYYNAQSFTKNNHLGDDWNGVGGGNTDLGDPIYSIAHGYVSFSENIGGGWGNVIRIVHTINENEQVESLYAHCQNVYVNEGAFVVKGQKIGTIGNNNGGYLAHLHLELRSEVGLPIGGGYSSNTSGYLDPTDFIQQNRR